MGFYKTKMTLFTLKKVLTRNNFIENICLKCIVVCEYKIWTVLVKKTKTTRGVGNVMLEKDVENKLHRKMTQVNKY